jgi:hypothetical protein
VLSPAYVYSVKYLPPKPAPFLLKLLRFETSHGLPGSVFLQRGDDVRVSVKREMDGAVPQPFLHDFRVDALQEQERSVAMAQGMEAAIRQPGLFNG